MSRVFLSALLTCFLAVTGADAAPTTSASATVVGPTPEPIPTLALDHSDVVLGDPVTLEDWGITIQLPDGWEIREDADSLQITSKSAAGAGIQITEEESLDPAHFWDSMREGFAGDPGIQTGANSQAVVNGVTVPLIEDDIALDETTSAHQLLGLFQFGSDEVPLLAIASALKPDWAAQRSTLEAILNSITPLPSEEQQFEQAERDKGASS